MPDRTYHEAPVDDRTLQEVKEDGYERDADIAHLARLVQRLAVPNLTVQSYMELPSEVRSMHSEAGDIAARARRRRGF
jgi:hypothetical protein